MQILARTSLCLGSVISIKFQIYSVNSYSFAQNCVSISFFWKQHETWGLVFLNSSDKKNNCTWPIYKYENASDRNSEVVYKIKPTTRLYEIRLSFGTQ